MGSQGKEWEGLATAKEIAKKLNISYQLVNYYTNIGLFNVSANKGNCRLYNYNQILERFQKIRDLKRRGYSLKVIRDELID